MPMNIQKKILIFYIINILNHIGNHYFYLIKMTAFIKCLKRYMQNRLKLLVSMILKNNYNQVLQNFVLKYIRNH